MARHPTAQTVFSEFAIASLWWVLAAASVAVVTVPSAAAVADEKPDEKPIGILLVTLDTTRADALGCYGGDAVTPVFDSLAARGVRYGAAIAPSPLTLPSHSSLLTGLAPPDHGVLDNGTAVLPETVPTLASVLSERGWRTGAFVASRVLDRRFGLARGFDRYDDRMAAENRGEFGYPERSASAVVDAALAWYGDLAPAEGAAPTFLWAHFYDPHRPYVAPGLPPESPEKKRYFAEIETVDREVGRLLDGLDGDRDWIVGLVGDHGESFGDHGEHGHGIFLYRDSLEVPMIVSSSNVEAPTLVEQPVATRRIAPTLLELAGVPVGRLGTVLPGIGTGPRTAKEAEAIYSQTRLPASAYGWSPLRSLTTERFKLIEAPRPELYDLREDGAEQHNLAADRPQEVAKLQAELYRREAAADSTSSAAVELDPELEASLRSLGYLSGASGTAEPVGEPIDPKDGIDWLTRLETAKGWLQAGEVKLALPELKTLVRMNPGNVPFLTHLARAQGAAGDTAAAVETLERALVRNPRSHFLHQNLADLFRSVGQNDRAKQAFETTLALNPRSAPAWLGLAEMAARQGDADEERRLLLEASENGTSSSSIALRLGQIEAARGDHPAADNFFREATTLRSDWPLAWQEWARVAAARGDRELSIETTSRLVQLQPDDPAMTLHLGSLLIDHGNLAAGRVHLERVVALAPSSRWAAEARRLLAASPAP